MVAYSGGSTERGGQRRSGPRRRCSDDRFGVGSGRGGSPARGGASWGSFGAVEDWRGEFHGSRATAAMECRGGSSPVAWGGGERAWEDQREATE